MVSRKQTVVGANDRNCDKLAPSVSRLTGEMDRFEGKLQLMLLYPISEINCPLVTYADKIRWRV